MKYIVTCMLTCLCFLMLGPGFVGALSFEGDFAGPLLEESEKGEKVFDVGINQRANLETNMKAIFYPSADANNTIWKAIRNVSVAVLIIFFVRGGVKFLLFAPTSEEEAKLAKMNLLYIIYGAGLLFMVTWILGSALDLSTVEGVTNDSGTGLLGRGENNLLIVILSFLKGAAFFVAIFFLIFYGYQMTSSFSEEEKLKNARTGILNVFVALIFIKIIDYVYFMAEQQDFKSRAIELIVQMSKFVGYIGGILFVLALIYAGYLLITSSGDEEKVGKAKTIVKSVFVIVLVVLLFMLVIFQVFNDLL